MQGKYVTYLNDSKGFNLFGVLAEKNGKVHLHNIKTQGKFWSDRNKICEFWLQKNNRLIFEDVTYSVEHIKFDPIDGAYYADLRGEQSGAANQVYMEELSQKCELL